MTVLPVPTKRYSRYGHSVDSLWAPNISQSSNGVRTNMTQSSDKKQRHELERRRFSASKRAAATQEEQRRAEANRQLNRQLAAWTPRRATAWGLMALALVVAAQHIVAHMGWRPIPISMGWQDIMVGYPTAGLLLVVGACLLPAHARRP